MKPHTKSSGGTGSIEVLVIQPDPHCPLDRFASWLSDEGITARVVQPFNHDTIPHKIEEDALVVLGGDMSSLDDHVYSWLADIRNLIVDASGNRKPTLGICLGAQLMAQAFGGTVTRGDQGLEAGVVRVDWQAAAAKDQLVGGLPRPFLAGSMHGDVIAQLPPSAVWLGMSDQYPHQVFRMGDMSWGVQFHPELSPDSYRQWLTLVDDNDPLALQRAGQGMSELEQQDETVTAHTEALARRFSGLVRATTGVAAG
ncbi:type 1 glutamine amidotransferase [Arthrobacter sp. efr-133-R2A-63]|uniref:type 1 glutamine amidotransferase n=1 Tax=Arthrobacter sp. efr-133-R2A-63 TaxID=3040278 RepID=UPI0025510D19|nr:type 1 glutamine amidotransferase [Arthrobacter sp. efr-133-R2A-63]